MADDEQDPEAVFADWLSHPAELGEAPAETWISSEHEVPTDCFGPVPVAVVGYRMADGREGRGLVGPLTWAFFGERIAELSDEDLVTAYAGWLYLQACASEGMLETDFESDGQEEDFLEVLEEGLTAIEIVDRYRLDDIDEFFEYRAQWQGQPVRGAGNREFSAFFTEDMPESAVPAIYTVLGRLQAEADEAEAEERELEAAIAEARRHSIAREPAEVGDPADPSSYDFPWNLRHEAMFVQSMMASGDATPEEVVERIKHELGSDQTLELIRHLVRCYQADPAAFQAAFKRMKKPSWY